MKNRKRLVAWLIVCSMIMPLSGTSEVIDEIADAIPVEPAAIEDAEDIEDVTIDDVESIDPVVSEVSGEDVAPAITIDADRYICVAGGTTVYEDSGCNMAMGEIVSDSVLCVAEQGEDSVHVYIDTEGLRMADEKPLSGYISASDVVEWTTEKMTAFLSRQIDAGEYREVAGICFVAADFVEYDPIIDSAETVEDAVTIEEVMASAEESKAAPVITVQPEDAYAKENETVNFTVAAEGTGLTYQWQYRATPTAAWANTSVTGAKTATLTVQAVSYRFGYQYQCVIKDASGATVTSSAASLNKLQLLILAQPENQYAAVNATAMFRVRAVGEGLTYQWQYRANSTASWANTGITGATTDTLQAQALSYRYGYQYRCVVKDSKGNSVNSEPAMLMKTTSVRITTQPQDAACAENATVRFTVAASGTGLAYQWQYRATSTSAWANTGITGARTATLEVQALSYRFGYQYRCIVTDADGFIATSGSATLSQAVGPVITAQPQNVSASIGQTAVFTVTATGTGLTYQWQYRVSSSAAWANTSQTGATTATLQVPATAARNGYQYHCIVKDSAGNTVTSGAATLTVASAALAITTQPVNATVSIGETAIFTVVATGSGLTYQWQYRATATSTWANTSQTGATTATLQVPATAARNGYQYRCIVKNSAGNTVTSNAATLTATSTALAITTQPSNVTAAIGETATFTVVATGTGLTYQWQYRATATSAWANTSQTGAKTATLQVPVIATRNGYQYHCVVKDAAGNSITSNAATLTAATSSLAITTQPANVTAAIGETATFNVVATGTGLTYQWQYRATATAAWANTSQTGAKTATLQVPVIATRNGYQYHCVVKDAAGNSVTSNAATLTVAVAGPTITTQPVNVTAVIGETAAFTVAATGTGLTYQWQYRATATASWTNTSQTGAKTATLQVPVIATRNGYQYQCVVKDSAGNTVTSNAATLTVGIAITAQPADVEGAVGETVTFTVAATGVGLRYQWQYRTSATANWANTSLSGATTAVLSVPVIANRNGYSYHCIITDSANNSVTSDAATLTVSSDFTFSVVDGVCFVTGYTGSDTAIVIPSDDGAGHTVTAIAANAFSGMTALTGIGIPNTITAIGAGAFKGCTGITTMTIPGGVTEIAEYTFDGMTGLASIDLPDGITVIGYRAFRNCTSLRNMT